MCRSIKYHISPPFIYPHPGTRKKSASPSLSKVALPTYILTSIDSDVMRRDRSVNGVPSPVIKTNACMTPPHLTRPPSSPGPKSAESWPDELRCQVTLFSHLRVSNKAHRIPPCGPPTRSQHHPSPVIPRVKTKMYSQFLPCKMYNPPFLPPLLMCNHFETPQVTFNLILPTPTITSALPDPLTTKTKMKQQPRHPLLFVRQRWFHLPLCLNRLLRAPPPPTQFLTITRRVNT
jgi:hypothetical protein